MPTAPPAPALFSMTTLWPSSCDRASATGRATVSVTPPGGNGTIIVTALSGYCAWAQHAASPRATPHHHLLAGTAMSPTLLRYAAGWPRSDEHTSELQSLMRN